jgi:O-antigen/teichoic acid export membrane protein
MRSEVYSVRRFRTALLQLVGGRMAQAGARIVLVLALVRVLPIEEFGAYMLIVGAAELLLQVGSFGILPLAQRYIPQLLPALPTQRMQRFILGLVFMQVTVLAVAALAIGHYWTALTPLFGLTAHQAAATNFAAWLFLAVPVFRFAAEILETMLGFGQIARAAMVFVRAGAVLLLIMLLPQVTLEVVLVTDLVVTSLCALVLLFRIHRKVATLATAGGGAGHFPVAEMTRFTWHMALVGVLGGTANPGALRLVLANGLGLAESGLFAFLQSLERLVSRYLPATVLRNLIRPVLISRYVGRGNTDLLKAGTGLLLKSNLLAVVGGIVVIAVCGDEIVRIMSGGKFVGAGLTLLLLYVNMIATSQRGVQEMVMQITGHTRALWMTTLVSPLALFLVWLVSGHGLNFAVLVITAGSLVSNSLATGVLQSRTDWFRVDWRGVSAIGIAGALAAGLGIIARGEMSPLLAGVGAFFLFVLFVRIGRPFSAGEIGAVERVVGKRAMTVLRGFAVG